MTINEQHFIIFRDKQILCEVHKPYNLILRYWIFFSLTP
jgi:hypothetical protein